MSAPSKHADRLALPGAILAATAGFVLLDWAFIRGGPAVGAGLRLHMAYVAGHRLFLALVCVAAIAGFARVGRRTPRWAGPLAAAAVAWPALFVLLAEDLRSFGLSTRLLVALVFALGPLALSAAAGWGSSRLVRLACVIVGVGLGLANHYLLAQHYPGFHLTCIALSQLAVGVGLAGAELPRGLRLPRWSRISRDAGVSLLVAWSVFVRPSNSVAVRLATDDAAPLYRFVAEFYPEDLVQFADHGFGDEYFQSRADAPPVPAGRPLIARDGLNVVVISIDALRHDVVEGQWRRRFHALAELRRGGVVFESAYAPATSTSGTFSALFTGRYFSQIQWEKVQVNDKFDYMPVETDTLRFPGLLTDAGVATYLVPTHWRVAQRGRMAGGFAEEYAPDVTDFRPASEALPALLEWLGRPREGPAFALCHLVDAHYPYDSAGEHGELFDLYMRELELVDRELGRFLDALKRTSRWDRTIVIVMADHGEAFGEHGHYNHGGLAYEEVLRVPLIVRVPGVPGRTVRELVSLNDLGPTILDLFGVDTPGSFMGQSLVPVLRGEAPRFSRPVAFHTTRMQYGFVFPDRIKASYIQRDRRMEVYDLSRDPGETTNLADEEWAQERVAMVRAFFLAHEFKAPGYTNPRQ